MDINILTPVNAAYIAGLIDGEGTVTLTRKHKDEHRHLAVSISNTELQLLEFTKQAIGAGKITRKRTTSPNHTPSYTYAIYNRQALLLIAQLQPYMLSYKIRRVNLILEKYIELTPRNGKYSKETAAERRMFENAVLTIKP
ncbi:MAG: LAGLIDADG family homing endonuclease [Gammaproteobacteria bacterium]|nr:LAGLIDADG family homing endonuclease [Gammaproteobacteria bacterium]